MTLFDLALGRTAPIHFWQSSENIETWSADALLAKARAISAQMQVQGVTPGDCVALMLPTGIDLVAGILAAWGCRAVVCIVPHTLGERSGELDTLKIAHILELLQPKLLLHHRGEAQPFPESTARQIHYQQWQDIPAALSFLAHPQPNDLALIQLTSGSTAYPKGVMLQHAQVLANMQAIAKRVSMTKNDHLVSWLPLYHDMGLSSLLTSLTADFSVTLIPTALFMRNPCIWMEAISQQRGTLSNAPTFAYALLAKQGRLLTKRPVDLSSWRYAWVGAEPVYPKHLRAFEETMRPFGLQDHVLQPAYGLAEAVVAVAFNPAGKAYRCLAIAAEALHRQGRVQVIDPSVAGSLTLVANGTPVDGVSVSIRHANGEVSADGEQGHVWIAGDCVTQGYLGGTDSQLIADGWFETGDLGFVYEGELYITGRSKDLIIRGGANISPAYVELVVEHCLGLRPGKVAAFSVQNQQQGMEEVVIVVGLSASQEQRPALIRQISEAVASEAGLQVDQVVFTAAGKIPKTTSGKVQRAAIKQSYLDNLLEDLA